jgi:hypothetical protein
MMAGCSGTGAGHAEASPAWDTNAPGFVAANGGAGTKIGASFPGSAPCIFVLTSMFA